EGPSRAARARGLCRSGSAAGPGIAGAVPEGDAAPHRRTQAAIAGRVRMALASRAASWRPAGGLDVDREVPRAWTHGTGMVRRRVGGAADITDFPIKPLDVV